MGGNEAHKKLITKHKKFKKHKISRNCFTNSFCQKKPNFSLANKNMASPTHTLQQVGCRGGNVCGVTINPHRKLQISPKVSIQWDASLNTILYNFLKTFLTIQRIL